jgi:hypothetical protein
MVPARCGTGPNLVRTAPVRLASVLLVTAAAACGGGDPASPTFRPTAMSITEEAGTSPGGDASVETIEATFARCDTSPATGSIPADVAAVLGDRCQTCHNDPQLHGAPFALLTYADVHQLFAGTIPIYHEMYLLIQPGATPHMPYRNAPQLSADQFKTLGDWLISCAPPGD